MNGIERLATAAMGTRFEIVVAGGSSAFLRAAGEAVVEEILLWHRRLSFFDPASTISRINRMGGDRWVPIEHETFTLLERCLVLTEVTGGFFDITASRGRRAAPDAIELDRDRQAVRFHRPDVAIDLGAVGKGYALDLARELLLDAGVACAFVHGGTSSAITIGSPPDRDAWQVQIAGSDVDATVATVELRETALGVSAARERNTGDGSHVLDPRQGAPATGVTLAAVVTESATDADAWSTALVAGHDEGPPGGATLTVDDHVRFDPTGPFRAVSSARLNDCSDRLPVRREVEPTA